MELVAAMSVLAERGQGTTLGSASSAANLDIVPLGLAVVFNTEPPFQLHHLLDFEEFLYLEKMTRIWVFVVLLVSMDIAPQRPAPLRD